MWQCWVCCWQERDAEAQALQQRLAEAEEAHEEELVDLQATIQSCSTKLQNTKVLLQGASDPCAAQHGRCWV